MIRSCFSPKARAAIVSVLCLFVLTAAPLTPARAAESVTIQSQTVACDSIQVTYTVQGSLIEEVALLYAHGPGGVVGFASGPGSPDGTYTVTIPVDPPQPGGTLLNASVDVGAAFDEAEPAACPGGEPGEPPAETVGESAPPWSGLGDGRLNPAPDEYYSIWCAYDQIEVWRGIPPPSVMVKQIPLVTVIALRDPGSLDLGDSMTLTRSGDTIFVMGNNGNLAPSPGTKWFSLSECIAHNGGAPEPEELPPPVEEEEPPPSPEEARERVREQIEFCFDSYDFLGDLWLFLGCIESTAEMEGASTLEILWSRMMVLCLTPTITAIPVAIVLGRRRRAGQWPAHPPSARTPDKMH